MGQHPLLVGVVDEAVLAGASVVPTREGDVEKLLLAPVVRRVGAVGVDQQQAHRHALEERLRLALDVVGGLLGRVEALDERVPLGAVGDLGDEVDRLAVGVAQQRHGEVGDEGAAVGADVALGDPVGADLTRERPLDQAQVAARGRRGA